MKYILVLTDHGFVMNKDAIYGIFDSRAEGATKFVERAISNMIMEPDGVLDLYEFRNDYDMSDEEIIREINDVIVYQSISRYAITTNELYQELRDYCIKNNKTNIIMEEIVDIICDGYSIDVDRDAICRKEEPILKHINESLKLS